jgi:hypothetical protein
MVYFPKEIFSSILEFCDTRDFDKHKQVWKHISVERVYDDPDCPDFYDDTYAICEMNEWVDWDVGRSIRVYTRQSVYDRLFYDRYDVPSYLYR